MVFGIHNYRATKSNCFSVLLYLAPTNNDAANRSVLNGGVRARSRPPGTENTVPTQGSMVLPELPTRPVSSGKNEYSRSSLI